MTKLIIVHVVHNHEKLVEIYLTNNDVIMKYTLCLPSSCHKYIIKNKLIYTLANKKHFVSKFCTKLVLYLFFICFFKRMIGFILKSNQNQKNNHLSLRSD